MVWSTLSLSLAIVCAVSLAYLTDMPAWLGAIYFFGQSLSAIFLLEIINYVEHYGLQRNRRIDDNRGVDYERVNVTHSWNSSFAFTNSLLFQLQRHSDHHAHASKRYQLLRHFDASPQLPTGYPTMVILALITPLWRALMDPRVGSYRQQTRS